VKVKYKTSEQWSDGRNDNKPIETEFQAVLDATETVEAVSDNGRPTKLTVKVLRCTKDGNPLLPAGTTITAETVNGHTQINVNGSAATDDQQHVLADLIYTARPDEPTGDEEMGTDKPQKVGDTWPVNGEALARATHLPFRLTAEDFKGQGKLAAVDNIDGRLIETIYLTNSCEFDSREGTNGRTYKNLKMNFEWTANLPADPAIRRGNYTQNRTVAENITDAKGSRDVHTEWVQEVNYVSEK
jgi:hypothetical protein